MKRARVSLFVGLALLAAAAFVDRRLVVTDAPRTEAEAGEVAEVVREDAGPSVTSARAAGEPLALALAPLGPIKAVLSSMLWVSLQREHVAGRVDRVALLSESLLELHPRLDGVREYLAYQLIVTEAGRAPDAARHEALVMRGLELLEEGIELTGSPRLHGALGRLLAVRQDLDPLFADVVVRTLGALPDELAVEHLGRGEGTASDRWLMAGLLIERGVFALNANGDVETARVELERAEAALAPLAPIEGEAVRTRLSELRAALAAAEAHGQQP